MFHKDRRTWMDSVNCRTHFSSYDEYVAYCNCVSKIVVGSKLTCYLNRIDVLSPSISQTTATFPVIGITNRAGNERIMLGSNDDHYGFWHISRAAIDHIQVKAANFNTYQYCWYLRTVGDGRIAKIELPNDV